MIRDEPSTPLTHFVGHSWWSGRWVWSGMSQAHHLLILWSTVEIMIWQMGMIRDEPSTPLTHFVGHSWDHDLADGYDKGWAKHTIYIIFGQSRIAMTKIVLQWPKLYCNDRSCIAMTKIVWQWPKLYCNDQNSIAMTKIVLQWPRVQRLAAWDGKAWNVWSGLIQEWCMRWRSLEHLIRTDQRVMYEMAKPEMFDQDWSKSDVWDGKAWNVTSGMILEQPLNSMHCTVHSEQAYSPFFCYVLSRKMYLLLLQQLRAQTNGNT